MTNVLVIRQVTGRQRTGDTGRDMVLEGSRVTRGTFLLMVDLFFVKLLKLQAGGNTVNSSAVE